MNLAMCCHLTAKWSYLNHSQVRIPSYKDGALLLSQGSITRRVLLSMINGHLLYSCCERLNGMRLKIRTSTCFLHGSRAPNSSAFERNCCRTALLTCLYFAFICCSYTKHTFMVDRRGVKPRLDRCKRSVLSISLPAHKKSVSLTRAVCKQAS